MNIQKSKLLKFVSKYNLNGTNDSVKFVVSSADSTLKTNFYASDKTLLGTVTMTGFKSAEDLTIGIYETKRFNKILGPCDDDLEVTPIKSTDGTRVTALTIIDKTDKSKTNFVTSDLSAIPPVPNMKKFPTFGIEIKISKAFAEKFIASKKAIEDVDTFTLVPDTTDKIHLVLGYNAKLNSNSKTLNPELVVGKDILSKEISFSAPHLENILSANMDAFVKDDSRITIKISEAGLATTIIEAGEYTSEYYLTEISKK